MEVLKPSKKALDAAVAALEKGDVIICSTDTVYGFLADATNEKAVEKIYKIKKRLKSKSLPIFVPSITAARKIAFIDDKQIKILKEYWPGKYTFVVRRKPGIRLYGIDKHTLAVRIPNYPFLNQLIKKMDRPLAQTSVNLSGEESMDNITDIFKKFGADERIALIIDGGNSGKSKPSKIMDITTGLLTKVR